MLSAEQREIRALAREFAEGELRPRTAEWDEARALDDDVFGSLAELGFLGMLIPEEHGGLDLDVPTYLLALEELAWGDPAVALSVQIQSGPVAQTLLRHGSEAQKEAWLPRLAAGGALGAFALSEPGAGSDVRSLETRAEPDGDGWRLTGTKKWVTNGDRAELVVVFARTGGDDDAPIGAFLVDRDAGGYRVTGREATMGLRASETVTVELDGVRVGADGLLGDGSRGLRYALEALDFGRIGVAAQALGIAQAAYEHSVAYAAEREQFGRPIGEFGAIREKVADMATRIAGARALTHEVARELQATRDGESVDDHRGPGGSAARAAMAKLAATEAAMWVADEAVQIYGGYGYMRDYPVEKLLRDAKGAEIYEGTSEIMRVVVGRRALDGAGAG